MGKKIPMNASGGFLKKMLGNLFRPAKRATRNVDVDRAVRDAADTNVRDLKKHDMWRKAAEKRDKLYDDLTGKTKAERKDYLRNRDDVPRDPSKRGPVSVTGATDPETGISRAGVNHRSSNPPLGGCAEDDALDQINAERVRQGLPPVGREKVYYSKAWDLDSPPGSEYPICNRNCQNVTDPQQYPPGTTPMGNPNARPGDPDYGRWFDPNRTNLPGVIE